MMLVYILFGTLALIFFIMLVLADNEYPRHYVDVRLRGFDSTYRVDEDSLKALNVILERQPTNSTDQVYRQTRRYEV